MYSSIQYTQKLHLDLMFSNLTKGTVVIMREILKKLTIFAIVLCMMLPLGSFVAMSEDVDATTSESEDADQTTDETTEEPGDSEEDKGNKDEDDEALLPITEEEALAKTKLIASNGNLELYLNEEEAHFAVKVKENGYIWWSEPYNAHADLRANKTLKNDLNSNLHLTYGDRTVRNTNKLSVAKDSLAKKNVKYDIADDGFTVTYKFNTGFTVPVRYTLRDDYLEVEVLVDKIVELYPTGEAAKVLLDVSVLPNMGAATTEETGYFVVPDGSGAIINFNNGKQIYKEYTGEVYGTDITEVPTFMPSKIEQVSLPMYGIVKEGNALLAVADKGDSDAIIKAYVSGQRKTSYNSAYFTFNLRSIDLYNMSNNTNLTMFETGGIKSGNIVVKYYPLVDEDASYNTIAQSYQDYLLNDKGVTKKTEADKMPMFVTLYGGMVKQQSVFGIPLNLKTATTTYDQAEFILKEFYDAGVDDVIVTYNNWNDSGLASKVGVKYDPASILGGKRGWNDFLSFIQSSNYTLYPSVEFMNFNKSAYGYSTWFDASMRLTNAYSRQTRYDLAFEIPSLMANRWSLLSPTKFDDVSENIRKVFSKNNMNNISFGTSSTALYSDFGKNGSSRYQSMLKVIDMYKAFDENGGSVLANGANAYILPYVDYVTNVPLSSSGFDVFDYDVPFLQLVLHGIVPYSTSAVNANADSDELFLKAIATGSGLRYDMLYSDIADLEDSIYDELFFANYYGWVNTAAEGYELSQEITKPLSDKLIIDHVFLTSTKTQTTFEDDTVLVVDYETGLITLNGKEYQFVESQISEGVSADE